MTFPAYGRCPDHLTDLLDQAKSAFEKKDRARALALTEQRYRCDSTPRVLIYLALIHAEERPLFAADLARRYLATIDPAAPGEARYVSTAQAILRRSAERPRAQVILTGPAGAQVQVDRYLAGALPLSAPLWLSPGPHALRVSAPDGDTLGEFPLSLLAGEARTLRAAAAMGEVALARSADVTEVAFDYAPRQSLPFRGSLALGAHSVALYRAGRPIGEGTVVVAEGVQVVHSRREYERRPTGRLVGGTGALLLGLLGISLGSVALALRGCPPSGCSGHFTPSMGGYDYTQDNLNLTGPGAGLLAGGLAIAAAGVVLLALPGRLRYALTTPTSPPAALPQGGS